LGVAVGAISRGAADSCAPAYVQVAHHRRSRPASTIQRLLWRAVCYDRLWPVCDRRVGDRRPVADLYLSLLGDLRRIVHLDPEIPDGALKVGISEEK
jgi:hypothetical protein